jgi:hypothetical protein
MFPEVGNKNMASFRKFPKSFDQKAIITHLKSNNIYKFGPTMNNKIPKGH